MFNEHFHLSLAVINVCKYSTKCTLEKVKVFKWSQMIQCLLIKKKLMSVARI